jgi:hypothetical protein
MLGFRQAGARAATSSSTEKQRVDRFTASCLS